MRGTTIEQTGDERMTIPGLTCPDLRVIDERVKKETVSRALPSYNDVSWLLRCCEISRDDTSMDKSRQVQ